MDKWKPCKRRGFIKKLQCSWKKYKFKFDWEGSLSELGKKVHIYRSVTQDIGVEIIYLIDTNIFLEILLSQKQKDIHKDAYQFKTAEEYGLSIVTQDRDFEKVLKEINIVFYESC